jgi:hypothetical protein
MILQTRLDFIAAGALSALTAAATPSPKPTPEPSLPPLHFDLAAFDAALNTAATHRHLFASTKIDGGEVFSAIRNTLNAYADIGIAWHDVFPVAAFYHGGSVVLAFDDAMWNTYFIPLQQQAAGNPNDYTKDFNTVYDAKTHGNPRLHKTGGRDDESIEALVADAGARFFVCNNATKGFAAHIAHRLRLQPAKVYSDLAAHLVPNAMLVPAGVWAVHAIQERRYTLLQTSV